MGLLDHNNEEKEVSTGSVVGKILAIIAIMLIIAFAIFMIVHGRSHSENVQALINSTIYGASTWLLV